MLFVVRYMNVVCCALYDCCLLCAIQLLLLLLGSSELSFDVGCIKGEGEERW